jgi:hypothetical protein
MLDPSDLDTRNVDPPSYLGQEVRGVYAFPSLTADYAIGVTLVVVQRLNPNMWVIHRLLWRTCG